MHPTRAARLRPAPGALPVRCPPSPRAPGEPRPHARFQESLWDLRYLTKLKTYENNRDVLDENERVVLKEFDNVLSKRTMDWLDKKWDLCPLLNRQASSPREFLDTPIARRMFAARDVSDSETNYTGTWDLYIDFSTTAFMTWDGGAQGNIRFP